MMFVCNFKLNGKKAFKIIFIILFILILVMCSVGIYKIFNKKGRETTNSECIPIGKINAISASNYTNVLKTVHENLNDYVGMKIKFTGFVYRLDDFTNSQFVLARQMIVSSDMKAVVVGFLCHLNEAEKYNDGAWIEIEGTITRGDYHGEIPVVEINKIKTVNTPNEEYVYPPDISYVPTSAGL